MDCKYITDKVWLYVEGDLQPTKQQMVTRHIASCRQCAGLVDEVIKSQQWLKSREAERFDDAALDSVRSGARQRIAELQGGRFRSLGMFGRLNWKPLIIACPILVLMCCFAAYWILDTRRISSVPRSIARNDGYSQDKHENGAVRPDIGVRGAAKVPVESHHKRRISRRTRPAPPGNSRVQDNLMANDETYQWPPLRIEIQTEDPNVRIIWFASPGDAPVPSGPDKSELEQERLCFQ